MIGLNGQIWMSKLLVLVLRAQVVVLISGHGRLSKQFKLLLLRHNGNTTGLEERDMLETSASQDQLLFTLHSRSIHQTLFTPSSSCSRSLILLSKPQEFCLTTTLRCTLIQSLEIGMRSRRCLLLMYKIHLPGPTANGEIHFYWIVSILNQT